MHIILKKYHTDFVKRLTSCVAKPNFGDCSGQFCYPSILHYINKLVGYFKVALRKLQFAKTLRNAILVSLSITASVYIFFVFKFILVCSLLKNA